jgi:hypothetical protein
VRFDGRGEILWQRVHGGVDDDEALAATADGDGFTLAGWSRSLGPGDEDSWIVGLDVSGAVAWQRRLGGAGSDALLAMTETADGGTLVAGVTDDDLSIVKLGPAGWIDPDCSLVSSPSLPSAISSATSEATSVTRVPTGATASSPGLAVQPASRPSGPSCAATPGEVSPAGALHPLLFDDAISLVWEPATFNCAESFNLYRDGACLSSGLPNATADDIDVPQLPGECFAYLVTATALGIEGTAGTASDGAVRVLSAPCP